MIPLTKLKQKIPWLPRKHYSQYIRWANRGLKGVKLRTLRAGGGLATTEAWLLEFFESLSGGAKSSSHIASGRSAARRTASVMRELEQDGI